MKSKITLYSIFFAFCGIARASSFTIEVEELLNDKTYGYTHNLDFESFEEVLLAIFEKSPSMTQTDIFNWANWFFLKAILTEDAQGNLQTITEEILNKKFWEIGIAKMKKLQEQLEPPINDLQLQDSIGVPPPGYPPLLCPY